MKHLKIYSLLSVFLLFSIEPANAQLKKVAQTGYQFLKVDMSARSAAMGGAYTMVGEDASAMFYNPGALSQMESNTDFFVNRTTWIADISYNSGALAKNFGNLGVFGISFISADYGDIEGTRVDPAGERGFEWTGNVDISAYAVGLGYSRQLTNKFSIGVNVKYASQYLGETIVNEEGRSVNNRTSGLVYDIGTVFYPGFESLRMGMSIQNFSQQFEYEETPFDLPLSFRIGFAMDILDVMSDTQNNSLIVSVDALHPRDWTERLHFGAEYMFGNLLAVRAGYKTNYSSEGLSVGFGVNPSLMGLDLSLDYSYSTAGVFNGVNRFTVGGTF